MKTVNTFKTSVIFAGAVALSGLSFNASADAASDFLGAVFGGGKEPKNDVEKAKQEDTKKGATWGAVVGGVVGAASGDDDRDRLEKGAIGAVVGGVLGGAAGSQVGEWRGQYAEKHNRIESDIAETDQKIKHIQRQTANIQKQMSYRSQQIAQMIRQNTQQKADINRAKIMLDDLNKNLAVNDELSTETQVQMRLLEQQIAEVEGHLKKMPNDPDLANIHKNLLQRRGELVTSLNTLNGIQPQLMAQKKSLMAITSS